MGRVCSRGLAALARFLLLLMLAWWGCFVSRLWPLTRVCGYTSHKCQQYRSVQEPILQSVMLPACLQIVPCHFGFRFCISFMLTETCIKPFWTTSIASSAGELGALTTCKPKPYNVSRHNHSTEGQQAANTWRPALCAELVTSLGLLRTSACITCVSMTYQCLYMHHVLSLLYGNGIRHAGHLQLHTLHTLRLALRRGT